MKEFSEIICKIVVDFSKFFHYSNDKKCKGPSRGNRGRDRGRQAWGEVEDQRLLLVK